jgi:hypothetical protein
MLLCFPLQSLEDMKTLGDCGFTSSQARAQAPATIGMAFRQDGNAIFSLIFLKFVCDS